MALIRQRVLLTTFGSSGDVVPVLAMAAGLVRHGCYVTVGTFSVYEDQVVATGARFLALPPDEGPEYLRSWMLNLSRMKDPLTQIKRIFEGTVPHIEETKQRLEPILRETDLWICSYLFPMFRRWATSHGIPFVLLGFSHHTQPRSGAAPDNMPQGDWLPGPLRRLWRRLAWAMGDRVVTGALNRALAPAIQSGQLERIDSFLRPACDLFLVGVSPLLLELEGSDKREENLGLRSEVVVTGYMRHQPEPTAEARAELETVFADGPCPVLTFGSVTFDDPMEHLERLRQNWPEGERLLIQRGWVGFELDPAPSGWRFLGAHNHDLLFGGASVVIHHGGAGTTASALYAGVPQIVIPHIADQPFFADRVERLGVGVTLDRRLWPEQLAQALSKVSDDTAMRQRALEVRDRLRSEDGVAQAIAILEKRFRFSRGAEPSS